MATYLLTWNPNKWDWDDRKEDIQRQREKGYVDGRWSCGTNKRIRKGDRIFLLRQGREPRGLVASGTALGGVVEDFHWMESQADQGILARYVEVRFDIVLDAEREPIFRRDWLGSGVYASVHWNTQVSGISIPDDVAQQLERDWARFLAQNNYLQSRAAEADSVLLDEPEDTSGYVEGAVRRVSVNAFERNSEARRACIRQHGLRCVVCGFDFEKFYGILGVGYIQVHHLVPLSAIGGEYMLDPGRDMRPVCPNCHVMLHRRTPPYLIEELQGQLHQP